MMTLTPSQRIQLQQVEGIVFDIQRYSLHDGPGLRTNVFLKGCPLRCGWCANPESQQLMPELALSAQNCIRCGQYDPACPDCWTEKNGDGTTAVDLGQRTDLCPTGAMHWLGRRRTAGDVIEEVLRDKPFYVDGGGLTLTGGEPTMQPQMAEALLCLAQDEGISTAIETTGYTTWAVLERLLPHLDTILYDVKHIDSEFHRQFTGVDNERILNNLRQLVAFGAPVTVRVPLIPGFNDDAASLGAIAQFVVSLNSGIMGVDLLPYHTYGQAKYQALGRPYPWADHQRLTETEVEKLADVIAASGLTVTIGG